jgi:hypothetical protein
MIEVIRFELSHELIKNATERGEARDKPGKAKRPQPRRKMPVRRGPLRGGGRIRLRGQLPLLKLPADDRFGFQAIRRHRARQTAHHKRRGQPHDGRRSDCQRHALQPVRLAALFGCREGAFVHVAMGSLVDDPTIRPRVHIFVDSKAPWFTITDDLPQYQEHVVAD